MSRKFTNEEIVNMAHLCVKNACDKCPLLRSTKCRYYLARYIVDTAEPKFDWDGFIGGKFAVNLRTQKDYDAFMQECDSKGLKWISGARPTAREKSWGIYEENFCVRCDGGKISLSELACYRGIDFNRDIPVFACHDGTEIAPLPAVTGTNSEATKDTNSSYCSDSILLELCRESLCAVAQTRNADYQIGYVNAVLDIIKKLKGEQGEQSD